MYPSAQTAPGTGEKLGTSLLNETQSQPALQGTAVLVRTLAYLRHFVQLMSHTCGDKCGEGATGTRTWMNGLTVRMTLKDSGLENARMKSAGATKSTICTKDNENEKTTTCHNPTKLPTLIRLQRR